MLLLWFPNDRCNLSVAVFFSYSQSLIHYLAYLTISTGCGRMRFKPKVAEHAYFRETAIKKHGQFGGLEGATRSSHTSPNPKFRLSDLWTWHPTKKPHAHIAIASIRQNPLVRDLQSISRTSWQVKISQEAVINQVLGHLPCQQSIGCKVLSLNHMFIWLNRNSMIREHQHLW